MKVVNKILILFLFGLSVLFFITWEFLQSRWVAKQVSTIATKYITEVLQAEVEFQNLQFNIFPPGANVKDVRFVAEKENFKIEIQSNNLGVYFNPFDVFETDFIVDQIYLKDGRVKVKLNTKELKKDKERSSEKTVDPQEIFDLLPEIPLNSVELENVDLYLDEYNLFARQLYVENRKNSVGLQGEVNAINLEKQLKVPLKVDMIYVEADIDADNVQVKDLQIQSGFKEIQAFGQVSSYASKNLNYQFSLNSTLPLNIIHNYVDLSGIGSLDSGIIRAETKVEGKGINFKAKTKISGSNLVTQFVDAETLEAEIDINEKRLLFSQLSLKNQESSLELVQPFEFYNFSTKKFVEEPVVVKVENMELENALKYLKESVGFLKGSVNGEIRFDLYQNSFGFKIKRESVINDFALKLGEELNVFEAKNFKVDDGTIDINGGDLNLSIGLSSAESQLSILATSQNGRFELKVPNAFVNLKDLSPVMGYDVRGKGILDLSLIADEADSKLEIKTDLNKIAVNEFQFDKLKANMGIDLKNSKLQLEKIYATSGKATVFTRGSIDLNSQEVAATYSVKEASFSEVKRILAPVMKDVSITTNEIHGNWDSSGSLSGLTTLDGLKVKGKFKGKNNYFFDENIDNLNFNYKFENGAVKIDDFVARKSGGKINLKFNYKIEPNELDLWSSVRGIPIQELTWYKRLPLTLKGELSGVFRGSLRKNKWKFDSKSKISNTYSHSLAYPDSTFDIKYDDTEVKAEVHLFDKQVVLNSDLFFSEEKLDSSYVDIDLNIPNLRNLFGIVSVVDLGNSNVSGRVKYSLRSRFNPVTFEIHKLETNMKNFVLNKKPIFVRYKNPEPEIKIADGKIDLWDVNIRGKSFYIISKGEGNLESDFKTNTQAKIDASIIEIFNSIITKSTGNIRANVVYGHEGGQEKYNAYLTSNNLSLVSELIPTSVTKSDFRISLKDKVLDIEKFDAQLVSGNLNLGGNVSLKSIIPDINIRYKFKDAGMTLFKKSDLIFSGQGSFVGKNFPYTLGGDLYIEKFVLVNELTDFAGGENSFVKDDIDFLPSQQGKELEQFINLNLNVSTRNPVFVRNSLADLGFAGAIQVTGSEKQPNLNGKIALAARNNKVTFKNNDFAFTKGNIFFSDQREYSNPELDFSANTTINEYSININVLGPVKNFNVELTSQPILPQADILSLVAFGYTEDLSGALTDEEREIRTRASVGSLLFDSLKVGEVLKKEFGLQINFGTEITRQEGSLLSGRNAEGSVNNRVTSATTLEIKKKINDAMTLSVSSTVDQSTQARQSMNLNYNINKNVSIEGVYETRNTDELETINVDNSVGADVKWKWSFK